MRKAMFVVIPFAMGIILLIAPVYCSVGMFMDLVAQNPTLDFWVFPPATMASITVVVWAFSWVLFRLGWCELQCAIHG